MSKGRTKSIKKNIKNKNAEKKNAQLNKEILGIVIIAIGIFILVSLYSDNAGFFGELIESTISHLTGEGKHLIPFAIIVIGVLFTINRLDLKENKRSTLIIIMYLCLLTLLGSKYDDALMRGGVIGGNLYKTSSKLFGTLGSYIIIYSILLISILLLTDISFIKVIKFIYNKLSIVLCEIKEMINKKRKNISVKNREIKIINSNESNTQTTSIASNTEDISGNVDEKIRILDYTKNLEYKPKETSVDNADKIKEDDIINNEASKSNEIIDEINIEQSERDKFKDYEFPCLDMLERGNNNFNEDEKKIILDKAQKLEVILESFGIKAEVKQISKGPTITRYELQPAPGVKVSKIVNLSNDIALGLASSDVRIEAPIPGKSAVGIEVPNSNKSIVRFREVLESKEYQDSVSKLTFALGKDIAGKSIIANIEKMPHLLVAGATGSGKSVCINTLITSILYKAKPDEVKLLLIDPKVVELSIYNGIPHLLTPVVTDPKKAAGALNWAVNEMTRRYNLFAKKAVRDFSSYNSKILFDNENEILPQIVIIIDELADLMMVAPGEVEESICRIAQMARAAGIHLIVATQRPSVDVITGTIKANIPSRLSFAVSSMADSRTILDMGGAEKLLGKGDMLFYPVGESKPKRVQCAFISDEEVESVVNFLKEQSEVTYKDEIINKIEKDIEMDSNNLDDLFSKAVDLVLDEGQASISFLQRKLKIGYSRAARIVDEMEENGIVGGHEGSKPRKVLVSKEDFKKV